jgi:hypothetical protein
MRRLVQITALSVALLAGLGATAHATVYSEGVSGDLSDSPSMPTDIGTLAPGDNTVTGSSIPSGTLIPNGHGALTIQDNDFFTFTIAAGQQLSYFNLGSDTTITSGDRFFLGIYPTGSTSVDPSNPTPAGLLGYTLPGTPQIGQNILPDLAASDEAGFPALATHFPGVLGAGSYTVWLVDGDSPVHYDLDLGITAVPEPSLWMLMIAGLGMTGATLRRRAGREPQLNAS